MKLKKTLTTILAFVLSFAIVEVRFALDAHAGMISTSQAVSDLNRATNLAKVSSYLERQDVRTELQRQGLTLEEANKRIITLSDFELQKVAGNIESAPAGAEPVVVIGIGTLLLIIIIILLVKH